MSGKRWVTTEVSDETHRLLCRLGIQWGRRPEVLLRIALQRFLQTVNVEGDKDKEEPLDLRIFQRLYHMKKDSDIESMLMEMAYVYQDSPTEENSDFLRVSCEEAGYTVEDILTWIKENQLVPLRNSLEASATHRAMLWLTRRMEPGVEYGCSEIMKDANGFSQSVLKAAKRKLGIRSVRKSSQWAWIMDKKE